MVAMAFSDTAGDIFFALFDGDHLGGTGFAGADIRGAGKRPCSGAFDVDTDQRILDRLKMLGFDFDAAQWLRFDHGTVARDDVFNEIDHMRTVHHAIVGERGDGLRELQRRVGVVALADADADGFAGVPLLLFRRAKAPALPCLRGQDAGRFAGKVDTRAAAETEELHESGDVIDAQIIGQHVVVGVAGNDDRFIHIDATMAADLIVAEDMVAEVIEPGVVDCLLGPALAVGEGSERHKGLEGGARRIGAGQCAVDHWTVDRLVEILPVLRVDAVDKQVGIETWFRYESEHAAVGRVNCHQRAAKITEGAINRFLQTGIEVEHDVVARHRRRA